MFSKLSLKNFLSWEDLDFTFPKGVTLIEGFNYDDNSPEGCGKSAILNGMTWLCFGKIPKDSSVTDIIRDGSKKTEGVLELESGHIIKRSRTKSGGILELVNPDGSLYLGKSTIETQSFIDEVIGMSYDTFLQSVYFAQNYQVKFITSDEKNRVKVLSDIAELSVFDKATKKVTELTKTEKEGLTKLEYQHSNSESEVENKEAAVEQVEKYKKEAEEELKAEKEKLSLKFNKKLAELEVLEKFLEDNTLEDIQSAKKEAKGQLDQTEKEIEELNLKFSSIEPLKREQAQLKENLKEAKQQVSIIDRRIKSFKALVEAAPEEEKEAIEDANALLDKKDEKIEKLKKKIEKLENPEDPICPTCGTPLDSLEEGHFAKEIEEIKEQIVEIAEEMKEASEELKRKQKDIKKELQKDKKELKTEEAERKKAEAKATKAEEALEALEIPDLTEVSDRLKELKSEVSTLKTDMRTLDTLERDIETSSKEFEELTAELEELDTEIEDLETKKVTKFDSDLKKAKKEVKEAAAKAKTVENLLKDKKKRIEDLKTLKNGFKETKAYTFRALLRDLTNKSNYYLAQLFDLPVSIEFTNETEAGGVAKIKDVVTIGDKVRPFALYSGGQSRRIQLAVDLALSDIVAARGDKPINLLVMDEVFKDLSENSMEKVLDLLESLEKSVLMIEHNSIIKNVVKNTITIELRDGVSKCL